MSKTLHFISHTHWDREWYLNFEDHRMRLVEVIDELLDTLDTDEDFASFHLDGQIIMLDDYLEIRPENKERIITHIKNGRLIIGPFYVLQDEHLTSAEANVRNILIGLDICKKYGPTMKIGYFPDTFGHISQMPQILLGFGITRAAFGRGINPIGRDNTRIANPHDQKYNSELFWSSPDGSRVLSVLFANWYNNAYDIPENTQEASQHIGKIKADAEVVASTPHLLMLNGCDHTPAQTNIGSIIKSVSAISQDNIIHSNFNDYFDAIEEFSQDFKSVEGELTSQYTDGMLTLVNTASAKIFIRKLNYTAEKILQKYAEPLNTISYIEGDEYRDASLLQAWKYILQNHSHDTICNCNIDDISEDTAVRFKKAISISNYVSNRSLEYITSKINTSSFTGAVSAITVFNPMPKIINEYASAIFELDDDIDISDLCVFDENGKKMPAEFEDLNKQFSYTLPRDGFRTTKNIRKARVTFLAKNISPLGYSSYAIKKCKKVLSSSHIIDNTLENQFLLIHINNNGTLDILEKTSGLQFKGFMQFEACADYGDTYNFVYPHNGFRLTPNSADTRISLLSTNEIGTKYLIEQVVRLPIHRDAKEFTDLKLNTHVFLGAQSNRLDVKVKFNNNAKDYRLRAHFDTNINSDSCFTDSHFDIVKRSIKPFDGWENPDHSGRQQCFVEIFDDNSGLLIANKGLPEYEILRNGKNTIALTLVRCVGEVGDWGYFPTPSAQCQGENLAEFSIIPYYSTNRKSAHEQAYSYNAAPFIAVPVDLHCGSLPTSKSYLRTEGAILSCFKKADKNKDIIARFYNPYETDTSFKIDFPKNFDAYECRMDESNIASVPFKECLLPSKKILTLCIKEI